MEPIKEGFDLGEALLAPESNDNKELKILSIEQLLSMDIPPRDNILNPIITSQSLNMVYGFRGLGKTHFVIGVALAVAGGGHFLQWSAERPFKVLYVDGEMPAVVVQDRFRDHLAGVDYKVDADNLSIITPDLQEYGMPNLSTPEGQASIEPYLNGIDLAILDNLSTLCREGKENEDESWLRMQEWLLQLRSRGISVFFVHHAGKAGWQRGTSKREDVLDTVIKLQRPTNYNPREGARVEVHFEKARGLYGDDVKPFEARLTGEDGKLLWECKDVEDSLFKKVVHMLNEGLRQVDIAKKLDVSAGTVSKYRSKGIQLGLITVSQ